MLAWKSLGISIAVVALTGCATSYQTKSFTGGFDDVQLSDNVWRVSFVGNGYTSRDRAEQMAILRSAELTLENGYSYFGFVDSRSDVDTSVFMSPTYSSTNMSGTSFGNSFAGTANTATWGGPMMFKKPSATNVVVMFKEKPTDGFAYNASQVCASIGAKYDVVCGVK